MLLHPWQHEIKIFIAMCHLSKSPSSLRRPEPMVLPFYFAVVCFQSICLMTQALSLPSFRTFDISTVSVQVSNVCEVQFYHGPCHGSHRWSLQSMISKGKCI
jgi:hypothetical protein